MKKLICKLLVIAAIFNITSCGTILHPERKNQGARDQLDTSIVVLNGIGLIFFIIPGVIAYAVDFNNDTIYLPSSKLQHSSVEELGKENMVAINIDKEHFNPKIIEAIVIAEAGNDVDFKQQQAYRIDKNGKKVRIL